jgi:hypothetical protein
MAGRRPSKRMDHELLAGAQMRRRAVIAEDYRVFTFGREHERNCAVRNLRKPEDILLITNVVNGVHDVLEGKVAADAIRPVIILAFSLGSSGVWEQTGSWLRKLSVKYPELESVWTELSTNSDGKVRFRVACFINELPKTLALEIGSRLKEDRHKRTREMAQGRLSEIG